MGIPLRTLILEEQPSDAESMMLALQEAGFVPQWQQVNNRLDYIASLNSGIDIILADYSLPQFNALRALEILKQSNLDIPFIIVTGSTDEQVGVQCIKQGAADYLLKDRLARLGEAVRSALYAKELRDEKRRVEEALAFSEARLRTVLNNAPLVLCAFDNQGIISLLEGKVLDALITSSNYTGLSIFDVLGEVLPEVGADCRRVLCGENFTVLHRITAAITVEMRFSPVRDATGQIEGAVIVGVDVTERQQVEDALRQSEAAEREQRTLAEALRDTIAAVTSTLDPDEVMERLLENVGLVVPHRASTILLLEGDSVRLAYWHGFPDTQTDVLPNLSLPIRIYPVIEQVLAKGKPVVLADDGVAAGWSAKFPQIAMWSRSVAAAPIQVQGHTIGLLNLYSDQEGFFTDIDAERLRIFADQAAVALRNAQLYNELLQHAAQLEQRVIGRTQELSQIKDRVEAILNHSTDAIIFTHTNGLIQQVNPAFSDLLGYSSDEAFNQPLVMIIDAASSAIFQQVLAEVAGGAPPAWIEVELRRSNSSTFDADLGLSLIAEQGHRTSGIVCSLRDISHRKKLENDLRQALAQEKELGELKTRFVSMVSHEFRTPLSVIMTSADILRTYADRLTEDQRTGHLEKINGEIKHLTTMLAKILTIGRLDIGKEQSNPRILDLKALCEDLIEQINMTTGRTHRFVFSYAGSHSQYWLDEEPVRQILNNLLTNAVKYSAADGEVAVHLVFEAQQVTLYVRDHGFGIAEPDQKHLFESFYRAPAVGHIPGTGLGLAIVKRAVEMCSGSIQVQSTLGVGSVFTVVIPASPFRIDVL